MPEFVVTAEPVGDTALGVEYGCKYVLVGPDGTRAVFNDDTDPDFVGILSPESSGLDSADVREDATDAIEEDGGHHGAFYEGRRPVVLQGTIIASSAEDRNKKVAKLRLATRALRSDATLKWKPAGGAEVELKLRRQQPLRITKGYTKEFQVGMVAADIFPKATATRQKTIVWNWEWWTGANNTDRLALSATKIWSTNILTNIIEEANLSPNHIEGGTQRLMETGQTGKGLAIDSTYVYYGGSIKYIGRIKQDGTGNTPKFIGEFTSLIPNAIAATSEKLYYGSELQEFIGRTAVAGGGAKEETWLNVGAYGPRKIVADATYLYWATNKNTIGRVKLNGESKNVEFIKLSGGAVCQSVFVTANYIYWGGGTGRHSIGRAKLNGEFVEENWLYMPDEIEDFWISGEYLYYANARTGNVGLVDIKGISNEIKLTNEGDAPAYPIVTITGETAFLEPGVIIENVTTGKKIEVTFAAKNTYESYTIDFKNHTIKKNGTEYAYNRLNFAGSEWWTLEPGENTVRVDGAQAYFEWHDTYL